MNGWLIRRTDQGGGFVAPPGSGRAYTRSRTSARVFPSFEAAHADLCPDNEVVIPADAQAFEPSRRRPWWMP